MFGRKKATQGVLNVPDQEPRVVKFLPSQSSPSLLSSKSQSALATENPHSIKPTKNRITPEFAYDLLMAEIYLETSDKASKETVEKLFELYKIGIEYYNVKQDSAKEGYFKKRLDSLSMHPAVLGMLHEQKHNDDNFYKKKQIERLVEINNKDTLGDVETMIKKIERVEDSTRETVEKGLSKQIDQIKKRIEKRKMNKPVSVKDQTDTTEELEISSPTISRKPKILASSTNKKGSQSFASPEEEDYSNLFVDGKYADC